MNKDIELTKRNEMATNRMNDEKVILFYGFLIHTHSNSEIENLLGLFSTLGTIFTFTSGILLATFSSVNQAEISSVIDGLQNSYSLWICISCGVMFGALGVIISLFLYSSLAAVNIPESNDEFLFIWLNAFKVLILILFVFFVSNMVCLTFSLYFLGLIKYQEIYAHSVGWGAVGFVFMFSMMSIIAAVAYLHDKVVNQFRNELLKQDLNTHNIMHLNKD